MNSPSGKMICYSIPAAHTGNQLLRNKHVLQQKSEFALISHYSHCLIHASSSRLHCHSLIVTLLETHEFQMKERKKKNKFPPCSTYFCRTYQLRAWTTLEVILNWPTISNQLVRTRGIYFCKRRNLLKQWIQQKEKGK